MKKFLLSALSVVTVAALAITGTIAWLQDDDSDVNVMTVGNVSIRQNEEQRVDPAKNGTLTEADVEAFKQAKPIYPYVDENLNKAMSDDYEEITFPDGNTYKLFIGDNAVDKLVSVTNTGKSDAYVRTIIALEAPTDKIDLSVASKKGWTIDGAASTHSIEVDGVKYDLLVCVYTNVLKPGETTPYSLLQILLDWTATNEDCAAYGDTYDVLVLSQAVQTAGFANAQTALNTAFGEVNAVTAAEWFGGDEFTVPVMPPADAVKVDSTTTFAEFADLLANGKNILVTESVTIANPESSRFTEFVVDDEVGIWSAEGVTLTFAETTGITGDGALTVYSGSIDEKQELWVGATLVFEGGEHSFAALSVSGNGKIVVNGGTLNCKGTYAGIMGITFAENGNLVVNGGKINLYQPINLNANRCDAAYVEFNDGTVELLNGIENLFVVRNVMDKDKEAGGVLRGSSVRVTGGTFIAHYEIDSAGDATSFIRNGDAPADGNKVLVSNADQYDCVVTGGTFYGSWQRADNTRYTDGNGGYADGKMVDNSVAGFVADGYQIIGDEVNGYVVSAK